MDYDVFGKETEKEAENRMNKVQVTFLKDVGRYKQEGKEALSEQIKKVKLEPEEKAGVRINLEEIIRGWDYWNDKGKVTRMAIIKPAHEDKAHNLENWIVVLMYDEHQTRVWRRSVVTFENTKYSFHKYIFSSHNLIKRVFVHSNFSFCEVDRPCGTNEKTQISYFVLMKISTTMTTVTVTITMITTVTMTMIVATRK